MRRNGPWLYRGATSRGDERLPPGIRRQPPEPRRWLRLASMRISSSLGHQNMRLALAATEADGAHVRKRTAMHARHWYQPGAER
jgi:hypothetical protein